MKSLRKGFTLVELMVVIVIIGVLAALAIPRFMGATNKTKATEFKPVLKQIYALEEAYRQENTSGDYGTLQAVGWDRPSGNIPYFGYGLGNSAVLDTAGQTTALTDAVPAALTTASGTGAIAMLASASPMTVSGQKIVLPNGTPLATADKGCVNTRGGILAVTSALASLTGASAPIASVAATCAP
jgi:prepilin-type N-terminal cleavage/methylation domain-containing protein